MPSQIMGSQADSDEFPCLLNHYSCRRIGDAENLLFLFNPSLSDIFPQAVCQLLRYKGNLFLPTTLGCLYIDSATVNVRGSQFKHFPDLIPPLAINSKMSRFLRSEVLKMISSTVSFSTIFQGIGL